MVFDRPVQVFGMACNTTGLKAIGRCEAMLRQATRSSRVES
jgi:hypothetical protein